MPTPEPPFKRVAADGAFSIREYPALLAAEVAAPGGLGGAGSTGFRRLARYIFGGNHSGAKIAMTAPVTETPANGNPAGGQWIVRFYMPAGFTLDTLPKPQDPSVRLVAWPAARRAVLRFSGWADSGSFAAKSAELLAWLKQKGLRPAGPVELAQYDPPWVPWFMRRNEVLVDLAP